MLNEAEPTENVDSEQTADERLTTRVAKSRILINYLLALLIILVIGITVWFIVRNIMLSREPYFVSSPTPSELQANTENPVNQTLSSEESSSAPETIKPVVDEGVKWQKPEKLSDLGLITKNSPAGEYVGVEYFRMGSKNDTDDIIMAKLELNGMTTYYIQHYFLKINNTYYRLAKNSDELPTDSYYGYSINYNLVKEGTQVLQSLLPDKVITKNNTRLSLLEGGWARYYWDEVTKWNQNNIQSLADTPWGKLSLLKTGAIENGHDADRKVIANSDIGQFVLQLADGTAATYVSTPTFMKDDGTFTNPGNKLVGKSYTSASTGGCGVGSNKLVVATGLTWKDDQLVGQSGEAKLYAGRKESDPASVLAFELYKYGMGGDSAQLPKTSIDIINDYGTIYWPDDYGVTHIYQLSSYAPQAECGKPVVYLYPTKTTPVSVKVGANVKISEPNYGDGWQVVAQPSGQLNWNGQTYNNLFWEGKGHGYYPEIDTGKVVTRAAVESTIVADLTQVGLNQTEIADFMEFWAPKLPNTPYVRLTWLLNSEMNELAPLTIEPRPDSVIRVFLDFAGLPENRPITEQKLPRYNRTGFTVVEWGGLLVE